MMKLLFKAAMLAAVAVHAQEGDEDVDYVEDPNFAEAAEGEHADEQMEYGQFHIERQKGEVIDVAYEPDLVHVLSDYNLKVKETEPLVMFFSHQTCRACKWAAQELAKLAQMT